MDAKTSLWNSLRTCPLDTLQSQIEGISMILIAYKDGGHKLINDVYHVPKVKNSILMFVRHSNAKLLAHLKILSLDPYDSVSHQKALP